MQVTPPIGKSGGRSRSPGGGARPFSGERAGVFLPVSDDSSSEEVIDWVPEPGHAATAAAVDEGGLPPAGATPPKGRGRGNGHGLGPGDG